MHFSSSDPDKTVYTKKDTSDRPYTKDEFYEAMKRMIVNGPSNFNYVSNAPDYYREITGEFRRVNEDLFISEQAPLELQNLFYSKKVTPQILLEHPEYIQFLKGKDLEVCFIPKQVKVEGSTTFNGFENLYSFLNSKTNFESAIDFIIDYRDIFDAISDTVKFSQEDTINDIQRKTN